MLLVDFDLGSAMIERDWELELGHYNTPGYSNMADVLEATVIKRRLHEACLQIICQLQSGSEAVEGACCSLDWLLATVCTYIDTIDIPDEVINLIFNVVLVYTIPLTAPILYPISYQRFIPVYPVGLNGLLLKNS